MFAMTFEKKLAIPMEVKEMYPLSPKIAQIISKRNEEIRNIFTSKESKFLLIIGPCSADREDSVMEYMFRLKRLQEKVKDRILIVPRVYTNKPRTKGDGYMGMLHQPDPREKPDLLKGIIATREMHMKVVRETGFVTADEMLYPENYKYVDDLLGYVSVGARSVENQQHRLTASGLDTPVGMKNPTSGDLHVMMNAIEAARHGHTFLYRGWQVHSEGNVLAHAILRGYQAEDGSYHSNFDNDTLLWIKQEYEARALPFPSVIIDTNHGNSGKNPDLQLSIIEEVMNQRKAKEEIRSVVKGFMVESYLKDGCQSQEETNFGQSITDPCLGWKKTEKLVESLDALLGAE